MTAWVLMAALPPTKGHLALVRFARNLSPDVKVVVFTQPSEPMCYERLWAMHDSVPNGVEVLHFHEEIEQNPEAPGFWDMWFRILDGLNVKSNDCIVASEEYGKEIADLMGCRFYPYDLDREIIFTKATDVRNDSYHKIDYVIPAFQKHLIKTVTFFGAESVGKTTLSKDVAKKTNSWWLPEWARPYLETVGNEITPDSMYDIFQGQLALQKNNKYLFDKPLIIQDTDLFSTWGYWMLPHWYENLKYPPANLIQEALRYKSDLYIILDTNIPFEEDPLRYGGNERESDTKYWIDICEKFGLNWVVLNSSNKDSREFAAIREIERLFRDNPIKHDRKGY